MKNLMLILILLTFSAVNAKSAKKSAEKSRELKKYEETYKYLEDNYSDALIVDSTTAPYKEYMDKFNSFKKMGRYIQSKLEKKGVVGFDLNKYSSMYYDEFKVAKGINKTAGWDRKNKTKTTRNMSYAKNILKNYINELATMEYPNIKWEDPKRKSFVYFQTLFKNYDKMLTSVLEQFQDVSNKGWYDKRVKNIQASERYKDFNNSLIEMQSIGYKIDRAAKLKKIQNITLGNHARKLKEIFRDLEVIIDENKLAKEKLLSKKGRNRNRKIDENAKLIEKKYYIKKIEEQIAFLKKHDFELIDKYKKSINMGEDNNEDENDTNIDTATKDSENEEETSVIVSADIKEQRENILSAENTSYSEIVLKYKKTLNKSEIEKFKKIKKSFSDKGYSDDISGFCAVRKLHDSLK